MKVVAAIFVALAWILLDPQPLLAWGPGTHIALGESVLGSLSLLPGAVRLLLRRYPIDFLYGSIAADISFAKKYVPEGRHCHEWKVGEEILASAETDQLRSMAFGYLAHLAADTVAHNLFVPRQLLLTSTTQALGHAYWEHRMDIQVGDHHLSRARQIVIEHDHFEADALFDRVLSRTIFSFQTNRHIFRGMIRVTDNDRWRAVFDRVLKNSRFSLDASLVDRYVEWSLVEVIRYLNERGASVPAAQDPIGDLNLRLAKKIRRLSMARGAVGAPELLREAADEFFPLPSAQS